MIWWTGQNLDQPIVAPDGTRRHFLVGHDFSGGEYVQRMFFWDEGRAATGPVEWRGSRPQPHPYRNSLPGNDSRRDQSVDIAPTAIILAEALVSATWWGARRKQ